MMINRIGNRLPQIDVLRGLACLGVFVFHVTIAIGFDKRILPSVSMFGFELKNIPSFFSFGASGVSLFFIVSGFCLTLKPIKLQLHDIQFKVYIIDRLSRVYPAYFAAVLFSILVATIIGIQWSIGEGLSLAFFLQGFIQKWHFSVNGALWSMSTEMQFYLFFPAIFWIFSRIKPINFIVSICIASLIYRCMCAYVFFGDEVVGGINTGTFYMNMLPGRVFEFAIGIFLAEQWVNKGKVISRINYYYVVSLLFFGIYARMKLPTWVADPALGLMWGGVVAVVIKNTWLSTNDIFAKFGQMSYSFFLIHVPIINILVNSNVLPKDYSLWGKFFIIAISSFLMTLILSRLLYKYVEIRFHRQRK